jgi:hypothetical protein
MKNLIFLFGFGIDIKMFCWKNIFNIIVCKKIGAFMVKTSNFFNLISFYLCNYIVLATKFAVLMITLVTDNN